MIKTTQRISFIWYETYLSSFIALPITRYSFMLRKYKIHKEIKMHLDIFIQLQKTNYSQYFNRYYVRRVFP